MNNLIPFYQKVFNLQDAFFTRIEHADAMVGLVYKIIKTDGEQFIF